MIYFDTSFLIPLLIPEKTSEQIDAYFQQLPVEKTLVASQWTRIELVSVISRLVRMEELDIKSAELCSERFAFILAENFHVVLPDLDDFNLGWNFLTRLDNSLRAGDALHLAIASNLAVEKIITLDEGMLKAGKILKLPVERGIF